MKSMEAIEVITYVIELDDPKYMSELASRIQRKFGLGIWGKKV